MKRARLKKNWSHAALLTVFGLSALAFLSQLVPLTSLSQAIQESAMTAKPRNSSALSFNYQPADPAHQIALFALG